MIRNCLITILACVLLSASAVKGQNFVSDSSSVQNIKDQSMHVKKNVRTVRGAVVRSSIFPGWGQWYNGQKLKAFLVLGGEIGLIGSAVIQNQRAVESKIAEERIFYENDRSAFLWYAAGFWLLSIIDAHVDAKLQEFDISEDLSFEPTQFKDGAIGISISYRF